MRASTTKHQSVAARDDLDVAPTYDPFWDRPIWGAKAIGALINRPPRAVYHLAATEAIDVSHCGMTLVSTPRRLLQPGKTTAAE